MKITTGSNVLDTLLQGGYEKGVVTTIYGPSGAGKTTACLLPMIELQKKTIFIDSEGGLSVERLEQLSKDYTKILEQTIVLKPMSFQEQEQIFDKLKNFISDKIGLIVVDTISMHYRLQRGLGEAQDVNTALGKQLAILTEIARTHNLPVLVMSQVYADFKEKNTVRLVGGDMLKYSSKCLLEFQIQESNKRSAIIRKHRSIQAETKQNFLIQRKGFVQLPHEEHQQQ